MQVAEAVADPVRRRVLELLLDGDLPAGEIAAAFDVSRPAVSRHLRVLREAGLVRADVVGRQRRYTLDRAPLGELDAWLDRFRPVDRSHHATAPLPGPARRLDALETEVRRGRRARASDGRHDERDDDAAAG